MANLFVIVATGIAWWSLVPQIVRLVKTRDPSGVSSAWPAIGLVTNAGWTTYLAHRSLWAAVPSTAVMTLSYSLVIWALYRTRRASTTGLAAGVVWTVVLTGVWSTTSWSGLGVALASSYVVQFTPAVVSAYRSSAPTGISPGTWVSIVVESLLWGAYGLFNRDGPIVMYAAVGSIGGAAILLRYRLKVDSTSTEATGRDTTKQV